MKVETYDNKIRIEMSLPVLQQQAWAFLTEKVHMSNWWGNHVTLDAKPGGTFREEWFDGEKQVVTSGKITRFNPPSELAMTWADNDWPGETVVTFNLSENGNNTLLMFEHFGWEIHSSEERKELIDAHATGWRQYLGQLENYATANH